jgi:superfamily II DNA/RNA helicase
MTIIQAEKGIGKTSSAAVAALTGVKPKGKAQAILLAISSLEDLRRQIEELGVLSDVQVRYCSEDEKDITGGDIIVGTAADVLAAINEPDSPGLEEVRLLVLDDAKELVEKQLLDHICKIDRVLGMQTTIHVRYIVLSDFLEKHARRMLRAIKSSLINKKNMLDIREHVARLKKHAKHYVVEGTARDWVTSLQKLEKAMWFPKAAVFVDGLDEATIEGLLSDFREGERNHGMPFVCNLGQSEDPLAEREDALKKFNSGQARLFVTTSHPSIFQFALPSVYWVIHFDVPKENVELYGSRLLSLDQRLRSGKGNEHGVSVLFTKDKSKTAEIEEFFGIEFIDLPFF